MLSAVTIGAVALGATLGIAPSATADPSRGGAPLVVDIVGDSYMAGDGITDTYLDPADLRHRSRVSPALQALSRVASENPGLRVDANVVASSGAVTADFFNAQKGVDVQGEDVVVNTAQHHQVRPNAQVVIVGFGGNDAELAEILAIAKPSNSSTPGDLHARIKNFGGLLDTSATDQSYLDQAAATPLGDAPTLVSRMLQVLGGIANRAPNARIIVTNYPLAVDPEDPRSASLIDKRDLITVQKFLLDLNETIDRAVQICECANLVDLTNALDGHEVYTADSAYAEPASGQPHPEAVQPNDQGAALMADPLATDLASLLGIRPPKANDGRVTVPENITARSGESDRDGDLVPDFRDEAPRDPDNHRQKHDRPHRGDPDGHHHHRDRSPKRDHDRPAPDRPPDRGSTVDLRDVLGVGPKDTKPGGIIPVQILPPPSPAPKRESDANELPEDRAAAESATAERKPAPRRESEDEYGFGFWFTEETTESEPAPENGFRSREQARDEVVGEVPEEATDWDTERVEPEEPATDTPAPDTGWVAEQVAPEGPAAAEPVEEPAAEAPAEAVPQPEQSADEATDGQQVCILIYPAPTGCGATFEPEGVSS